MPVAKLPASALFPVTFGYSVLGGPGFLVLFSLLFTGLCCLLFVLVCSCSFAFALVACSVSRCFAVAFLGLGLSCLGRVGLRFGCLACLFVRSRSGLLPVRFPRHSPWLLGLGLSCCGRVGLRFGWVSGLSVRSFFCSRRGAFCGPRGWRHLCVA